MLYQGLVLTVIGISTVFLILLLQVASMTVMSKLVRAFSKPKPPGSTRPPSDGGTRETDKVAAAIAIAVARSTKR